MERKRWTADDIDKLKAMAQKFPPAQIAAELGRGLSAITVKAYELRISLRMEPRVESRRAGTDAGNCRQPKKDQ
jgi:hypothetical protein